MEKRKRYLIVLLLGGLLLFVGLVFQQWTLANIILPAATVVWLLLRIFVLSIGQQVYWWALILLVAFIALVRFLRGPEIVAPDQLPDANPTLDRVDYWCTSILADSHAPESSEAAKRDLTRLITSIYATGQGPANYEIEQALMQREIPLPPNVYAFLFAAQPVAPRQPFFKHPVGASRQIFEALRQAPRKQLRKWTGREAAEFYGSIDEVLAWIETSLEMRHATEPIETDNH